MNIIVFGKNGLVGHTCMTYFEGKGHTITGYSHAELDMTDHAAVMSLDIPDGSLVINCAANVGGIFKNMNNGADMAYDNTLIDINLIVLAKRFPNSTFFMFSSTCAWGESMSSQNLNSLHSIKPHATNKHYAVQKRCLYYLRESVPNVILITIPNLYGYYPNIFQNIENGHVIPSLLYKFMRANGRTVTVNGTGEPLRQFVYAKDIPRYIEYHFILNPGLRPDNVPFLVKPTEITIGQLVLLVKTATASLKNVVFTGNSSENGTMRKKVDESEGLNFVYTNIVVGLAETVAEINLYGA